RAQALLGEAPPARALEQPPERGDAAMHLATLLRARGGEGGGQRMAGELREPPLEELLHHRSDPDPGDPAIPRVDLPPEGAHGPGARPGRAPHGWPTPSRLTGPLRTPPCIPSR